MGTVADMHAHVQEGAQQQKAQWQPAQRPGEVGAVFDDQIERCQCKK